MGIMDQAAALSKEAVTDGVSDRPRDRPILSIATPASRSDGQSAEVGPASSADAAEVGPSPVEPVQTSGSAEPVEQSVASDPSAAAPDPASSETEAVLVSGAEAQPSTEVSAGSAPTTASEEAEHEGVEIARRAKDGEESSVPSTGAVEEQDAGDPVGAAIAAAVTGVDPVDPATGVPSTDVVEPDAGEKAPPKTEMDYHQALSHINRTAARRGHVDIDDRISEYVRTNRREALDRPAPLTVKRELRAIKNGTVDEKLIEARRIVSGGLESKDVTIQVAIDQMEARKGKGDDSIKSLTKGPATRDEIDPATMAAAAATKGRTGPGL
jgi:hypothetical protein